MPEAAHMGAPQRILVIRLGSMGDIVHTLPAVAALRDAFPQARLDWLMDRKWLPLLGGNPDVSAAVPFDPGAWRALRGTIAQLRAAHYDCAIDFQGLYKSALLAFFSGARRRIGFARSVAREGGAALFYTERIAPAFGHVVEQNLALSQQIGGRPGTPRFPLRVSEQGDAWLNGELAQGKVESFYVLCPGGGWRAKCWPAEQYGHLHRRLAERHGWRGLVSYGPGERALAEAVRLVAGEPEPLLLPMDVAQLKAALRRAKFVVAGDTGPLHLAAALGTPVVCLYGPTDPARNGPYGFLDSVVRNAHPDETTYKRSTEYAPSMLRIHVDQVVAAIERRLGMAQ